MFFPLPRLITGGSAQDWVEHPLHRGIGVQASGPGAVLYTRELKVEHLVGVRGSDRTDLPIVGDYHISAYSPNRLCVWCFVGGSLFGY